MSIENIRKIWIEKLSRNYRKIGNLFINLGEKRWRETIWSL